MPGVVYGVGGGLRRRSRSTRAACARCWPRATRCSTSRSTAASRQPVIVKDQQRDAGARARASTSTCCEVRLDEKIQSTVAARAGGRRGGARASRRAACSSTSRASSRRGAADRHPRPDRRRRLGPRHRRDDDARERHARPAGVDVRSTTSRRPWSRPSPRRPSRRGAGGDRGRGRAGRRGGRGAPRARRPPRREGEAEGGEPPRAATRASEDRLAAALSRPAARSPRSTS